MASERANETKRTNERASKRMRSDFVLIHYALVSRARQLKPLSLSLSLYPSQELIFKIISYAFLNAS